MLSAAAANKREIRREESEARKCRWESFIAVPILNAVWLPDQRKPRGCVPFQMPTILAPPLGRIRAARELSLHRADAELEHSLMSRRLLQGLDMSRDKIEKRMSRLEAMQQLERLLQELKDGRVSVGRKVQRLPASDEVDFLADLNDDCLRLELRW